MSVSPGAGHGHSGPEQCEQEPAWRRYPIPLEPEICICVALHCITDVAVRRRDVMSRGSGSGGGGARRDAHDEITRP